MFNTFRIAAISMLLIIFGFYFFFLRTPNINSFNFRDVQIIYLRAAVDKYRAIFNLIDMQTELLRLSGGIISEF